LAGPSGLKRRYFGSLRPFKSKINASSLLEKCELLTIFNLMKIAASLSDRKVELTLRLLALDDVALLEQVEDFMDLLVSHERVKEPIPQEDLAAIACSIEESKTAAGTPLDEYLKELEML
jgi:hypothetical protein